MDDEEQVNEDGAVEPVEALGSIPPNVLGDYLLEDLDELLTQRANPSLNNVEQYLSGKVTELQDRTARLAVTIAKQKDVIKASHEKTHKLEEILEANARLEESKDETSSEQQPDNMKDIFDAKIDTIRAEIALSEERTASKLDGLISQQASDASEMKLILANAMEKISSTESRTEAKADELKSSVSSAKFWAVGTAIAVTSIVLTSTFRFNTLTTKASDANAAWTKELIQRVENQSLQRDDRTSEAIILIKDSLDTIAAKLENDSIQQQD